ncbi:DUF6174 domain-containing protein [Streptomyces sp. NPDC003635]
MNPVLRRARALSAAVLGGALLSMTAACGSEEDGVVSAGARQEVTWEEPAAYTYTLESTEGERALIGKFKVTVRGGEVAEAVGLDDSARRLVAQSPDQVPTIGDVLAELDQARKEKAHRAEAEHAADGHPERISIDWLENAIDDEASYVITDYRPKGV